MTRINAAAAERIITQILRQPERFDMGQFFEPAYEQTDDPVLDVCGTTACIAGWAVINRRTDALSGSHDLAVEALACDNGSYAINWAAQGAAALGLSTRWGGPSTSLFYVHDWPVHYKALGNPVFDDEVGQDVYVDEALAAATLLRHMIDGTVILAADELADALAYEEEGLGRPAMAWWLPYTPHTQEA